jgi:hypothetical protein
MGVLYVDGPVRGYHDQRAISSNAYVAGRHLAMPATTDHWVKQELFSHVAELGRRRQPKHLLSGLLIWASCGASIIIVCGNPCRMLGVPEQGHL